MGAPSSPPYAAAVPVAGANATFDVRQNGGGASAAAAATSSGGSFSAASKPPLHFPPNARLAAAPPPNPHSNSGTAPPTPTHSRGRRKGSSRERYVAFVFCFCARVFLQIDKNVVERERKLASLFLLLSSKKKDLLRIDSSCAFFVSFSRMNEIKHDIF